MSSEPVFYVTVPVYRCDESPGPPDGEGRRSVGHMHLWLNSAEVRGNDVDP